MMTGRFPVHVFRGWSMTEGTTLASLFAGAGYNTGFFTANSQLVSARHFDLGFGHYELLARRPENDADADGVADDDALLAAASHWLKGATAPFLLWVHFTAPHSPYSYFELSTSFYEEAYRGRFEKTTGHTFAVANAEELERVRDLYDGEVHYADHLFAQMMATLRDSGRWENTIVVLTADHGEEFMEHGGLQHGGDVYEELLRIPLVIRHPDVTPGSRADAPVSNLDLLPTLAEMVGLAVPPNLDGTSLLSAIDESRLRLAFSMTGSGDNVNAAGSSGRHKVIFDCEPGQTRLFDLVADSRESTDLSARFPERLIELEREVAAALGGMEPCRAMADAVRRSRPEEGLDEETRRSLEALGYLGEERSPRRQ
jgi:arylsulfatase A-like enzyme